MWNIRFPGEEEWDFCLEYLKENQQETDKGAIL